MRTSIDMIKIKRGLDIPLAGAPIGEIDDLLPVRAVALIGPDYHGMKPTMAVQLGDSVKRGELLFTDKKCEGVRYTSPAGGRVAASCPACRVRGQRVLSARSRSRSPEAPAPAPHDPMQRKREGHRRSLSSRGR